MNREGRVLKTIYWYLHTGFAGCTHKGTLEVPDDATEDEIETAAKDEAFNPISWGWSATAPEDKDEYEPEGESGD
jgi:predicted small lipoprotein YifL